MSPSRRPQSKVISVSRRLHIPRKCKLRADNRGSAEGPGTAPMQLLTVRHITSYRYKQPVSFGEHRMMLRPRDSYDQRLIEARLEITPEPSELNWMHDPFGNCVAIARFSGRAAELRFDSTIRLDHERNNALEFQLDDYAL